MSKGKRKQEMAQGGPHLIYARSPREDADSHDASTNATLTRALRLAREVEELLEETSSRAPEHVIDPHNLHSTRIVRAMAASLVDELEAMVRSGTRRSGTA